jgi:polyisoprenyl-teichoic acid--peptidoglycan teichoic acid transferase
MKKIYWIYIIGAFLLSAIVSFFLLNTFGYKPVSEDLEPVGENQNHELSKDTRVNFLLLGYGGAGHDGGYLSDVVMIVSVDPVNKKTTLISIPRDLWVTIPIQSDKKQNYKINAAYAIGQDDRKYPLKEPQFKGEYGGGNMAMKVVEDTLDLKINNYAAVDFSSFENIVDLLGGVEVDVPKTFDDYFYPVKGFENETCGFSSSEIAEFHAKYSGFDLEKQFTCRYEHLHFDKGKVLMDGATALKFVRSRHSNEHGGDFARGERQNAVLFATKDKLFSIYAAKNAESLYKQFQNLIKTDLTLETFKTLSVALGNPKEYTVKYVGLSVDNVLTTSRSSNGQFILIPKEGENAWSGVQQLVHEQINSN